jgi:hypothetical protein
MMIRHFNLLTFLLLLSVCRGQNYARFFCPKGDLFRIRSNNGYVNMHPQAEVLMENTGSDTLRISLEQENGKTADVTVYLTDKGKKVSGKEFDFMVDFSYLPSRLTFTGMYEKLLLPEPLVPPKPVEDTSYKINNNLLGHFCELKDGRASYFNNLPGSGPCKQAMPGEYMNYIQLLMRRAQTDDAKYAVSESVARNNCLSVAQLSGLLQYSDYEIEKLKLIKIAYFNLVDTVNRRQLESSFRFSSSVRELKSFFKTVSEHRLTSGNCLHVSDTNKIAEFRNSLAVPENDAQRYELFKKTYTEHCYSVPQIRALLQLFIHDREKLETAKRLYFYCPEKENYMGLTDLFSYKETASEFEDFIGKQMGK